MGEICMYSEDDFRAGLDRVKTQKNENSASENVKDFYKKNEPYITSCYSYYLQYKSNKSNYVKSAQYEIERFKQELIGTVILVLTANPIEEGVLLHGLTDAAIKKMKFFLINDYAYHVCHLYEHTIVHMHTGKTGEEFTRKTINAAGSIFEPDVIVLLGICYGIDFQKHTLGEVFISSGLKTYRLNFRDSNKNDETIFEAEEETYKTPNNHLITTVRQIFSYRQVYSFIPEVNGSKVSITWDMGTVLSSNSLMSSKRVKEAVIKAFGTAKPKPLGGEMEGGGLLKTKVVEEQDLDRWLVVKGICDWGEKKNFLDDDPQVSERMKDAIQAMAMVHAWSIFYEMLAQECFKK